MAAIKKLKKRPKTESDWVKEFNDGFDLASKSGVVCKNGAIMYRGLLGASEAFKAGQRLAKSNILYNDMKITMEKRIKAELKKLADDVYKSIQPTIRGY